MLLSFTDELWKTTPLKLRTKASSTKNQVTMTYDQQRSQRKYVCSAVPKGSRKPGFVFTRLQCRYWPFEKRSSKLLLVKRIPSFGRNCLNQQPPPEVQSIKDGYTAFNPKDWDVWVKKQPQSGARCSRFSSICGSKRGSSAHFWRTTSQVDDTESWKRNIPVPGHWPPHVLRRWHQSKEGRHQLCRKDQSCLAFWEQPGWLCRLLRHLKLITTRGWTIAKIWWKNSSSSKSMWIRGNLLSTKVKN